MMRSLYSGVSGLKVHQTKMDVIGNNIANVNTAGFKGSSVTFSDIFYQTTQSASGANPETGKAGRNAIQIGLGANLAAITQNISTPGGSQRTDNPFDCMISGDGFFIVNDGTQNYFTKSGRFLVDAAGTLCTPTGAKVMGWQVDADGNIVQAKVSPLKVMAPENLYAEPEPTTQAFFSGNINEEDKQLSSAGGVPMQLNFYDNIGALYTAKLSVKSTGTKGQFDVSVTDIVNANDQSIFVKYDAAAKEYVPTDITKFKFGDAEYEVKNLNKSTGEFTLERPDADRTILEFNTSNGTFKGIYKNGATDDKDKEAKKVLFDLSPTGSDYSLVEGNSFSVSGIEVDFSSLTKYGSSSSSKLEPTRGDLEGYGAGIPVGNMTGMNIDGSGKIYGVYDNGTQKLLGQIAVATFANPSGLEAVGNSMFAETKNSGEFDGVGQDVGQDGGEMSTGVLEMSNVDLSTEFTNMITTQRGFQANSRIITTSDTMIEELVNLKR